MFSAVIDRVSSYLDQRLIRSLGLPSLVFWLAICGLLLGWVGIPGALVWWKQQPSEVQALLVIASVTGLGFFVTFLSANLDSLLRLYEGYWQGLPVLDWVGRRRKKYYQDVLTDMARNGRHSEIYLWFPPPDLLPDVMPTRLGNVLKNSEIYPYVRYGIDAVLVFPRLYNVVPDRFTENLGAAKADLDQMLVVSFLGGAFAILGGLISVALLPWYVAPICLWLGAGVAWGAYESAVRNAIPYAQLVKSAFDLYRSSLNKTIGWNDPDSYDAEQRHWTQVKRLWYNGSLDDEGEEAIGYPRPSEPTSSPDLEVKIRGEHPHVRVAVEEDGT